MSKLSSFCYSLLFISGLLFSYNSFGQYATKKVSKTQKAYTDSLKNVEYNYIFPLLGQKAYQAGFDIPYPAGVMANFFWTRQGLLIDNLALGIESKNASVPLTEVDFIEFGDNITEAYQINVRPDLWILPFLNVYGIFGYGQSITIVNLVKPIEMKSVVTQDIATKGFGITGAFGIGPAWMAVDANWTWTNPELVKEPVLVNVLGIRLGQTYTFKNKPYRNFAFWLGAMRVQMGARTEGSIAMRDAISDDVWNNKDQFVSDYWDWYDGLQPGTVPGDAAKKAAADRVLNDFVDAIDQRDGDAVVSYGLNKAPTQEWNMVIGGQYQINKTWIIRSEVGLLGDRYSYLLSLNYRFKI